MLRMEQVSAGYGREPVIEEISVDFAGGEITAIIGPNGSGKSTLMKSVMDLCDVLRGKITLDDRERKEVTDREFAKKVAYLPQIHTAGAISTERMVLHGRFPYLSYPRHYGAEDYALCHQAMERIGILHLKGKKMEELSGGERQKVYLAMMLVRDADIYLFDEPTTYLDVRYQVELLALMQELKKQGKTVIAVLHDINSALRMADHVLVMECGRIAAFGDSTQIYESGILNEVFGVTLRRFLDETGKAYYFVA